MKSPQDAVSARKKGRGCWQRRHELSGATSDGLARENFSEDVIFKSTADEGEGDEQKRGRMVRGKSLRSQSPRA